MLQPLPPMPFLLGARSELLAAATCETLPQKSTPLSDTASDASSEETAFAESCYLSSSGDSDLEQNLSDSFELAVAARSAFLERKRLRASRNTDQDVQVHGAQAGVLPTMLSATPAPAEPAEDTQQEIRKETYANHEKCMPLSDAASDASSEETAFAESCYLSSSLIDGDPKQILTDSLELAVAARSAFLERKRLRASRNTDRDVQVHGAQADVLPTVFFRDGRALGTAPGVAPGAAGVAPAEPAEDTHQEIRKETYASHEKGMPLSDAASDASSEEAAFAEACHRPSSLSDGDPKQNLSDSLELAVAARSAFLERKRHRASRTTDRDVQVHGAQVDVLPTVLFRAGRALGVAGIAPCVATEPTDKQREEYTETYVRQSQAHDGNTKSVSSFDVVAMMAASAASAARQSCRTSATGSAVEGVGGNALPTLLFRR